MFTQYEKWTQPIYIANDHPHLQCRPHMHSHIEMVYMLQGVTEAHCDDRTEILHPGDVYVAFPNQIHWFVTTMPEKYYIYIFAPDICPEFRDLFQTRIPEHCVYNAKALSDFLPEMLQRLYIENQKPKDEFRDARLRGYFLAALGELFAGMNFRPVQTANGNMLKSILNYCEQHFTENLSLEDMSRDLHVGKYYISHIFNEKLQVSFNDYINERRVQDAILQIRTLPDKTITEIAYDAGFNNTRTFNRAFLKFTGTSPRDYRKEDGEAESTVQWDDSYGSCEIDPCV